MSGRRGVDGDAGRWSPAANERRNAEPAWVVRAIDAYTLDQDPEQAWKIILTEAEPPEVAKYAHRFERVTLQSTPVFLRQYERRQADFLASKSHPVSPTPPTPKGVGESGERASAVLPNGRKPSFGESGEIGDKQTPHRPTLTPFCELDAPPLPPDAFLFRDILIRGHVTIFHGAPGAGKSTVAYFIAAGLARDGRVFGSGPGEPIVVAILDKESSDSLAREKAMLASEGCKVLNLLKLSDDAFSGGDAELIALLQEHDAQLLIIDTLNRALPVNKDCDSTEAINRIARLFRVAREVGVAVLVICHEPKGKYREGVYNVLGSIETIGGVDIIVSVRASGPKKEFLHLTTEKNRVVSTPPVELCLRKMGKGIFEIVERAVPRAPSKQEALANALEAHTRANLRFTSKEALRIGEKHGVSKTTVERALHSLIEAGGLRKVERGLYEGVGDKDSDARSTAAGTEGDANE